MKYANEPSQAALVRASQDAYDVIALTPQQGGCVDSRLCGTFDRNLSYFLPSMAYFLEG